MVPESHIVLLGITKEGFHLGGGKRREFSFWLQISWLSKPWINMCHALRQYLRLDHGCKCTVFLVAVSTMTNSCIHYEYLQVFIKLKAAFWSVASLQLCNMSACSEASNHICSSWTVKKARCERALWKLKSFRWYQMVVWCLPGWRMHQLAMLLSAPDKLCCWIHCRILL